MKTSVFQYEMRAVRLQRNYAVLAAGGLLLLCLLLAFGLIRKSTRIVAVPPQMHTAFWVTDHSASSAFVAQWASYYADLRFNKTPSNARTQSAALLQFVSPTLYTDLKQQLAKEDQKMVSDNMTTSFFLVSQKVSGHPLCTTIVGDFHATVKQIVLPVRRLKYRLCFKLNQGQLQINSFLEEGERS